MPSRSEKSRSHSRFRLIWSAQSAPKVNWWRGLIGLQTRGGKHRGFVLHLAMKGLLLWSGSLAVICFMVTTAVGAYVLSRNPYNRISYTDLVLPTRWDELRSKRGEALIDEGLNEIKEKRYGAGIMLVAHGLGLKPSNISARIVLGQMYAQSGYVHRALEIFRTGLPYAYSNQRYLRHSFSLAEYLEDDEQVLEMIHELREILSEDNVVDRRWLLEKEATALVSLGRYDEVLSLREQAEGFPGMGLNTSWAKALSGLNRADEAISVVEQDPAAFGVFGEPWRLLIELALVADRPEVGRRAAERLVALDRADFAASIEQIVYLVQIEATTEWEEALERYFLKFGFNEEARVMLLKRLEGIASTEVLQVVWSQQESLGQISIKSRIAYVQGLILAGEEKLASQAFEITVSKIQPGDTESEAWAEGSRLLFDVLLTEADSSMSQLKVFCADHPLNPDAYRMLVTGLLKNGLTNEASEIAELARNRFPSIKEIPDIEYVGDSVSATEVMAAKRKKNFENRMTSPAARKEWDALQEDIQSRRWESAEGRLQLVSKSPFAKSLGDGFLYDAILIHGQRSNQTELSWNMRRLMERKSFDISQLRTIASELHDHGRADSALTLLREILRKHPEAKWAATLRQHWLDELKTAPLETGPGS